MTHMLWRMEINPMKMERPAIWGESLGDPVVRDILCYPSKLNCCI